MATGWEWSHRVRLASFLCLVVPPLATPCLAEEKAEREVAVETDKLVYERGETIHLKVSNGLAESIFLPGCNRFEIERRDADRWHLVYELRCFWEGFALEVKAEAKEGLERDCTGFQPGRYRVHVRYQQGCKKDKPMSQAACTGGGECISPEFRIE